MTRIGLAFFLMGMSVGFPIPTLTNVITAQGLGTEWVRWAWLCGPVAALLSPVGVGALADNRFDAQKVLGWIGVIGAVLMAAAYGCLDLGVSPWWFIGLLFASSVVSAPMWSTLASLSMTHLRAGRREFPLVRMGGTVGWMAAGVLTSVVLHADSSTMAGYAGAVSRTFAGLVAFALPATPPLGRSRSLRVLLGFEAFRLLKERDHAVFFATTLLLAMPLAAFYMWTPAHLLDLGDPRPTSTMALGQASEIVAMLLMAALMTRFRVKSLLVVALGLSALRYALFAWSGAVGAMWSMWVGISLHGMCYTFYFITAQLYLDRRVPGTVRAQAQGLLALVNNGFGTLLGAILVSKLYDGVVAGRPGEGWLTYWAILAGFIGVITVGFALSYRGRAVEKDESG